MLRLAWLSDLHLNFLSARRLDRFVDGLEKLEADALCVGGDIAEAPGLTDYLRRLTAAGKPVYFVLGNHDYYQGSIPRVRDQVRALCQAEPLLHWLPDAGPVLLSERVALVGHGGWGDARVGDYNGSKVRLNDFCYIAELTDLDRATLRATLRALGQDAAASLAAALPTALASAEQVLVLTHVPPFREACWHLGELSATDWLPHFTCGAVGELLRRTMIAHPTRRMTVWCGHTHSAGSTAVLANLQVETAQAEYGFPAVQALVDFVDG